jgi:hypothetical protein
MERGLWLSQVERPALNRNVAGSNPARPATINSMRMIDTCDLCHRRGVIWSNENNTRICKKCNNSIELELLLNQSPETEDDTR